jgi:cathepsin L
MTDADLSADVPASQLPLGVDWRNVTTAVKDQGQCGGCWSFSVSETIESHVALQTGKLLTLSEQEILSCTPNKQKCGGTGGCEGATQELGFGYVVSKGLVTEAAWPYKATDSACTWTGKTAAVGITGFVALPTNNYTALVNAVSKQPIAISAAAEAWQLYSSGVLKNNCGTDVDHAIQLVGFGTDSAKGDYWLVRNSWGPSWGEAGYIRIARFGEGKEPCAADNSPGDGNGCAGGPSSISVCGTCGILSDSSYPLGGHLAQ